MTIEQLLLLAVFVLAWLLNLVVQALRRRRRQQTGQTEEEADLRPQPPALPPSAIYREMPAPPLAPPPTRALRPRALTETAPPPPAPARHRRRPRVAFRRASDVRRAFVLMTVLGPCRGLARPSGDRVG